jgi:hypothetical protein
MGRVVYEQQISCSSCRSGFVIEYVADAEERSSSMTVQCCGCDASVSVTLARPAAIFLVRPEGDEPVLQSRLA